MPTTSTLADTGRPLEGHPRAPAQGIPAKVIATGSRQERSSRAWALLLASPDMDAKGTSTGIAQASGVTCKTVNLMRRRLRQLWAEGRTPTGTWAEDISDGPRPPRPTRPPKASRRAEEREAEKAEALAQRRQMIARQEAEAAAWRQQQVEARAVHKAPALLPPTQRRRKVIAWPPRPGRGTAQEPSQTAGIRAPFTIQAADP